MKRLKPIAASLLAGALAVSGQHAFAASNDNNTTTPIKHVIVVIAENHSFDNLFATYQPQGGQQILNLLSQGIVNADGSHGPNVGLATQNTASDTGVYDINPQRTGSYGNWMPMVDFFGPVYDVRYSSLQFINWLPKLVGPSNGPFQITKWDVPYATPLSVTGSPVHRFFQMYQQTGGTNAKHDLFAWVPSQTGAGDNTGFAGINTTTSNIMQGSEALGFFNMSTGDAPYLKSLADQYAMSDNFHQSVMGGTGMNFYAISTGGKLPVYNVNGQLATPPANQIENPNPKPGTNNFYTQDGYSGGSYVNCSDNNQPGVATIANLLSQQGVSSGCAQGAYYLVNNYNLPYSSVGTPQALGSTTYVFPPQTTQTVADLLTNNGVSWKWYTAGRDANDFVSTYFPGVATDVLQLFGYNNLGDPLVANTRVMTGPMKNNLQSLNHFYSDVSGNTLPAVSFIVPPGLESGHPGSSAPVFFEGFVSKLINDVQANSSLWQDTAIIVTSDEGGGYFDTGAIQQLDFFGDGPRIGMIVVSPYAKQGYVGHQYSDHSSIMKFIEKNWSLPTIAGDTRDNLPNPVQGQGSYLPANAPAIDDMSEMFSF
ncbi:MAG: phosphoesterase [Burkholderiales bacterium]|nr:phosphoesterase [Burkholderiales bacterium]